MLARYALLILVLAVITLMHAAPPYPDSPVITDITFNWGTHVRQCPGSDNWPVTWGDDGHQYVSWGDGGGFTGKRLLRSSRASFTSWMSVLKRWPITMPEVQIRHLRSLT